MNGEPVASSRDDIPVRTAIYYLTFVCLGLGAGAVGPTIPALAEQTGSTLAKIGGVFLAGSTGYSLGTLLGGRLFDRLRGHPLLGAAQIFAGIMLLAVPFAPRFWILALIIGCKGLTDGIMNTGVNTLLVWTHRDKAAPYMNGLHFAFGLGAFLAPLLAAQVLGAAGGHRWVYRAVGALDILTGLLFQLLKGSPAAVPNPAGKDRDRQRHPLALVLVAMLFLFFYVGAEITFGNWIYTYALTLGLASASGAAYLNSAFWLSFTVGRLISIPAAARIPPRRVIPAALLGCLAMTALALLFPRSGNILWVTVIGLGFCMAPVWPSGFTLAGQSIHLSARLSSIILLGDSLGGMLLPWLVGQMIQDSGPRAMVFLVCASLVLNLAAFFGMIRSGTKTATNSQR